MSNLNNYQIESDDNFDINLIDNSIETVDGISVYFRDIENKLLNHISKADAVFGAVAWLTNYTILDVLAKLSNVSLIVQKENFLRSDLDASNNWQAELRKKYSELTCNLERYSFQNILCSMCR